MDVYLERGVYFVKFYFLTGGNQYIGELTPNRKSNDEECDEGNDDDD